MSNMISRRTLRNLAAAMDAAHEAMNDVLAEIPDVPQAAADKQLTDRRINTTLRIEPEKLEALKIIALRKRVRVNDLVLHGIDHVIALNKDLAA